MGLVGVGQFYELARLEYVSFPLRMVNFTMIRIRKTISLLYTLIFVTVEGSFVLSSLFPIYIVSVVGGCIAFDFYPFF